jgi:hypothetical protein
MKKLVFTFAIAVSSVFAAIALSSNSSAAPATTANESIEVVTHCHATAQGKHCSGSVGCSCTGFSPITNGDVWQQAYCKHCGHKKSCHH